MATIVRKLNKSQCMILKNALKNNNGLSRMVLSTQVEAKIVNGEHFNTKLDKAERPKAKLTSKMIFDREDKYGAHNYHPLPVALCRGKGNIFFIFFYYIGT